MKRSSIKNIISALSIVVIITFNSCTGSTNSAKESDDKLSDQAVETPVVLSIDKETTLLLDDLKENGDYVNGREFPSLIKASVVYESLDENILIVDIRDADDFSKGHIKGAVNQKFNNLPEYFESGIKPFEYERIIIVSSDGQASSYTTALLRLMGYGNVYSMRWGMSAWSKSYSEEGWLAGSTSEFQDQIQTSTNDKPVASGMPLLNSGAATGEEIGMARFKKLFEDGLEGILITSDEVFSSPSDYFIINYDRKDKYENGHIPGAIRYKPGGTLSYTEEMSTIDFNRPVVVYCGTGHNSGFVTAYLRLFGYDAHTLKYGNNGFMYNKMVEERNTLSWLPFTLSDVNDYEVVK